MDADIRSRFKPGAKVRVVQQIAARDRTIVTEVKGTIIDFNQRETGSWYAHSKDDKLWLDRLVIRKENGEVTTLNLDAASVVEIV